MLLVWLFALASGVVHACVGASQVLPAAAGAVMADVALDAVALPDCMTHQADAGLSACLKFCDDESNGVAVVKVAASPQAAAALAVWPTLALALQAACDPLDLPRAEPAPPPAAVSVPIAFLRLTL